MLPSGLVDRLNRVLKTLGDNDPIIQTQMVGGGCINRAVCLLNHKHKYFLKYNPHPFPGMFEAEASGLRLMRETGAVRVPQVLSVGPAEQGSPAFLLLEWLEPSNKPVFGDSQYRLGQQLASMHKNPSGHAKKQYGLGMDNYIGSTPQINTWKDNWVDFFRDCRLGYQRDLAIKNGKMPGARLKKLDDVISHLENFIGDRALVLPSLIHGDLWGGNIQHAGEGYALIDPAVYFGDHEAELAFTELFGGFSAAFYRGYAEVYPIDPGYKTRKDLYNLYHLLNHLNLFGESYGSQVDAVLRKYSSV